MLRRFQVQTIRPEGESLREPTVQYHRGRDKASGLLIYFMVFKNRFSEKLTRISKRFSTRLFDL